MGSAETSDIQSDRPGLHSQSSSPVLFRQSPLPSRMKLVLALLLTVLGVSLAEEEPLADIPEVVEWEMKAFEQLILMVMMDLAGMKWRRVRMRLEICWKKKV